MSPSNNNIIWFYKYIILILIVFVSFFQCRDIEFENSTNELSFAVPNPNPILDEGLLSSALNGIQNVLWNELMDPIPMIAATITYMVLKFTGIFGFLRLLYTIINQSNT